MGFRIEQYNLNELHRIALPGVVEPSLFWALPVGKWNQGDLQKVWRGFTESDSCFSHCKNYGLLLVKGFMGRSYSETTSVNLDSVGAKLSDLMPDGVEQFIDPVYHQNNPNPRMLVLSGSYPQPGWGVLIEWPQHCGMNQFEKLIHAAIIEVIKRLPHEKPVIELGVFKEAVRCLRSWNDVRDQKPRLNVSALNDEIDAAERLRNLIREIQTALEASQNLLLTDLRQKIGDMRQAFAQAAWLGIEITTIDQIIELQQNFTRAALIQAVSAEDIEAKITPAANALGNTPTRQQLEATYKSLGRSSALKNALRECLHLRQTSVVETDGNFSKWAEETIETIQPQLLATLRSLSEKIRGSLEQHRGQKAQWEYEYGRDDKEWKQRSEAARNAFHAATGKAVELQWKLGPQFLVAFEIKCQMEKVWVKSIPWDPARMVGWKIMASQIEFHLFNLRIAARRLATDVTGDNIPNERTTEAADGSYFTDYVHHIAVSKPGYSPRSVTRDLLASILNPNQITSLIEMHTGEYPREANDPKFWDDPSLGAEKLLHALGWWQSDEVNKKPLAGCIRDNGNSPPTLEGNPSGNDLRIVLESFCKDIVDVVVAKGGWSHNDVWDTIDEKTKPFEYKASSKTRDWEEEVHRMTAGTAVIILRTLGPLAFPEQVNVVEVFVADLTVLLTKLNNASHDRESEPVTPAPPNEIAQLIRQLLDTAEILLGDLPWHLNVSFVYGEQPKVLSGEAWSHGSPSPRLLRVLAWTGTSPGKSFTFWNRERRNPVVPDPRFIVRPRKN